MLGKWSWRSVLILICAFILVAISVVGPIYAFVVLSCVSTTPCYGVGALLWSINAYCSEGDIEDLHHGEVCTVVCRVTDYIPSNPQLMCQDGDLLGKDKLYCTKKPVFLPPVDVGLIASAITSGEVRTACERATRLQCDAPPGGTATLLMLANLSKPQCSALLTQCSTLNKAFSFMDFYRYPYEAWRADNSALGTCSLGCYVPLPSDPGFANPTGTTTLPVAFTTPSDSAIQICPAQPVCVQINGSCNEEDNTDYYNFPACASQHAQWVSLDESRRIRFDGLVQYSQSGMWLLERKVPNPMKDTYGEEVARQPSFGNFPQLNSMAWIVKCFKTVSPVLTIYDQQMLDISLSPCSCTDRNDCSGNGKAVGSKDFGPNCHCKCNATFTGEHCEVPLCKTPDVIHAKQPACAEGAYLLGGVNCTPQCNEGYKPSVPSYICSSGVGLVPSGFECVIDPSYRPVDTGVTLNQFGALSGTTSRPACSALDCSYRGEPTGTRDIDGNCLCDCYGNFSGPTCMELLGLCQAPSWKSISNSKMETCLEGLTVQLSCTPQCQPGYTAFPRKLTCSKDVLIPSTFSCFGGEPLGDKWCASMKAIAIAFTAIILTSMLCVCLVRYKVGGEKIRSYFYRDTVVLEVDKMDDCKFYVVRGNLNQVEPHLPARLQKRVVDARVQEIEEQQDLEAGRFGMNTLFATEEKLMEALTYFDGNTTSWDTDHLRHLGYDPITWLQDRRAEFQDDECRWHKLEINTEGKLDYFKDSQLCGADVVLGRCTKDEQLQELHLYLKDALGLEHRVIVPESELAIEPKIIDLLRRVCALEGCLPPGAAEERVALPGLMDLPGMGETTEGGSAGSRLQLPFETDEEVAVREEPNEYHLSAKQRVANRRMRAKLAEAAAEPPYVEQQDFAWSLKVLELEQRSLDAKRAEAKRLADEQSANATNKDSVGALVRDSADQRRKVENDLRDALRQGDGDKLRVACACGRTLLESLNGVPPGPLATLTRVLLVAESRVEQFEDRSDGRAAKHAHVQRVAAGDAPDWSITQEQMWRYAEEGNIDKVRAGLKAMLPVTIRSKDGERLTLLHVACRSVCLEEEQEDIVKRRLAVVEALLLARAAPDALDAHSRTPLDLAVCSGCPDAASLPVTEGLRKLGLKSARVHIEASIRPKDLTSPSSDVSVIQA